MAVQRSFFDSDVFIEDAASIRNAISDATGLSPLEIRDAFIEVMQEECINWTGTIDKEGYARKGSQPAYRLAYIAKYGPIPKGLEIDHLCFNRRCVNTDHLEAVTHAENMRRARRAHLRDACVNGHWYTTKTEYRHNGIRLCRTCNADAVRRYKARKTTHG